MHFAILAVLLGALPVAHVGETLAVPSPGTLIEPGHFHAAVRLPHEPDRLFIVGKWTMQDLRVTIVRDGRRVELHGAQLPGARFGVELPPDAWQASAVEIDGTSVNQYGAPKLVAGTALLRAGDEPVARNRLVRHIREFCDCGDATRVCNAFGPYRLVCRHKALQDRHPSIEGRRCSTYPREPRSFTEVPKRNRSCARDRHAQRRDHRLAMVVRRSGAADAYRPRITIRSCRSAWQ